MDNASRPRSIDQIILVLHLIWSPWQLPFVAWRCSLFFSLAVMTISSSFIVVIFAVFPSIGILEPWRDVKSFAIAAIGVTVWCSLLLCGALSLPIVALWLLSFIPDRSIAGTFQCDIVGSGEPVHSDADLGIPRRLPSGKWQHRSWLPAVV